MATLFGLMDPSGQLSLYKRDRSEFVAVEQVSGSGPRGRDAVIFVPPSDVNLQRVPLNARNERDARRAAPFAVEDDLAQSPEDVHVALGSEDGEGGRLICSVRQDVMDSWILALREKGAADASLCVPQTLLADNQYVQGSQGAFGRLEDRYFAIDSNAPGEWLAGLLQTSDSVARFEFGDDADAYLGHVVDLYQSGAGIDLRQGSHAVRTPLDLSRVKRWRLAGALAAVLGIMWIGIQIWSVQNLNALSADLERRSVDVVQAGWPDLNGNVDLALQDIRVSGNRGGAPFPSAVIATAALYDAIGQIEASELRNLRYDRERGQVLAIVAYSDFADSNRLAGLFEGTGLRARVGDARQSGRQVVAELVLEVGS
ncbi:MAG: type II secretion system protein GspL [Pseudomonadota bacterium]